MATAAYEFWLRIWKVRMWTTMRNVDIRQEWSEEELAAGMPARGEDGKPVLNIVVVRRGVCTFVNKVRVAQDAKNAHAVIIVDREDSESPGPG